MQLASSQVADLSSLLNPNTPLKQSTSSTFELNTYTQQQTLKDDKRSSLEYH